jgi:hypothetical protein
VWKDVRASGRMREAMMNELYSCGKIFTFQVREMLSRDFDNVPMRGH